MDITVIVTNTSRSNFYDQHFTFVLIDLDAFSHVVVIVKENKQSAEQVTHQRLRPETDGDTQHTRTRQNRADVDVEYTERGHRDDEPDNVANDVNHQRYDRSPLDKRGAAGIVAFKFVNEFRSQNDCHDLNHAATGEHNNNHVYQFPTDIGKGC